MHTAIAISMLVALAACLWYTRSRPLTLEELHLKLASESLDWVELNGVWYAAEGTITYYPRSGAVAFCGMLTDNSAEGVALQNAVINNFNRGRNGRNTFRC
jgi:hypothetical protein